MSTLPYIAAVKSKPIAAKHLIGGLALACLSSAAFSQFQQICSRNIYGAITCSVVRIAAESEAYQYAQPYVHRGAQAAAQGAHNVFQWGAQDPMYGQGRTTPQFPIAQPYQQPQQNFLPPRICSNGRQTWRC